MDMVEFVCHIQVVGNLRSIDYHKAEYVADLLVSGYPKRFSKGASQGFMEFQWREYKDKLSKLSDESNVEEKLVLNTMGEAAIFSNGELRWNTATFSNWAEIEYLPAMQEAMQSIDFPDRAFEAYSDYISNEKYSYVFMEFSHAGKPLGQISFELFKELCPKTTQNFVCLCTGEKGAIEEEDSAIINLTYSMSLIHRVVPNGWIQGGDICGGNGDGGYSIYGRNFADECFAVKHNSKGILGMVNHGRNTNNSQFYITLAPAEWMNTRYMAFGRVIEGIDTLEAISNIKTFNDRPQDQCLITQCGILTAQ